MKIADIPSKFNIPFAASAGAGYVRQIPQASQSGIQVGAASLTDGFPAATFQSTASGGKPPFGEDLNGILKQITQWSQWQNAGATVQYDATFATAIGGYPAGTVLGSYPAGVLWVSLVDDNLTNPDTGGSGWAQIPAGASGYGVDTGSQNALVVNVANPPPSLYDGLRVLFRASYANTGAATLNWGGLGVRSLVAVGSNLEAGVIVVGGIYDAVYVASLAAWALIGQTDGQLTVPNATTNGSAVNLSQLNSAVSTEVTNRNAAITAAKAYGSMGSPGAISIPLQNGQTYIRQWGYVIVPGPTPVTVNFGTAFPNAVLGANATGTLVNNGVYIANLTQNYITLDNDSGSVDVGAYWEAWGY